MKGRAHFRVVGRLDNAARVVAGTVTIDRSTGLFAVRPLRRRRVYELPLSTVADMVCARMLRAEAFAQRLARAEKRKAGRC